MVPSAWCRSRPCRLARVRFCWRKVRSSTISRRSAIWCRDRVRRLRTVCGCLQTVKFQPLDGTLQEVKDVSNLWRTAAASGGELESGSLLVGRQATEAAFKLEAHRYRVLHLATHGFFLDDACAPIVGAGTRGVGGLTRPHAFMQNPLHLSGLAFAGANRRA